MAAKSIRPFVCSYPKVVFAVLCAGLALCAIVLGWKAGSLPYVIARLSAHIGAVFALSMATYMFLVTMNARAGMKIPSYRGFFQLALLTWMSWGVIRVVYMVAHHTKWIDAARKVMTHFGGGDSYAAAIVFVVLFLFGFFAFSGDEGKEHASTGHLRHA